jgi:hypothetical protein
MAVAVPEQELTQHPLAFIMAVAVAVALVQLLLFQSCRVMFILLL